MPRLVVLNACRMHDAGQQRAASGVMDGFLGHKTPAIVSMRGDIGTETARKFSGGFYRRLASGDPVDLAVGRARHAIHFSSGFPTGDWARPILTVQADPDSVLRLDPSCPRPDAVLARAGVEFQDVRWLVDRSEERRAVARLIDPPSAPTGGDTGGPDASTASRPSSPAPAGGPGLVLVGGGMQVGKSTPDQVLRAHTPRARAPVRLGDAAPEWQPELDRLRGARGQGGDGLAGTGGPAALRPVRRPDSWH
ncbi:MAG: CHAT domain-containing protein [Egibacteraceae bacterium]